LSVDVKKVVEGTDEYDEDSSSMWYFHFEEDQCCGGEDGPCENRFYDGHVKIHAATLEDVAAELFNVANEILDAI
jgi:hypothetical protein